MPYPSTVLSTQIEHAAQQALVDFLTPPRKPLSEAEQACLDQATSWTIPFGAINIHAYRWGRGSTVMLVHGWGGYGLQLAEFVHPLLTAGYQVLTFDAPAHGLTAGLQTSGFELAQAIATVAQHQGEIAGIVAHSLGAASTTLALSEGLQTDKVVYIGAMCWLSNALSVFAKRARLSIEVEKSLRGLAEERFGQDLWQKFSVDRAAQNLSIPAILFHDRRDREVSLAESVAIAQNWSGARLIETEGLGHHRILRDGAVIQQTVDFLTNPK